MESKRGTLQLTNFDTFKSHPFHPTKFYCKFWQRFLYSLECWSQGMESNSNGKNPSTLAWIHQSKYWSTHIMSTILPYLLLQYLTFVSQNQNHLYHYYFLLNYSQPSSHQNFANTICSSGYFEYKTISSLTETIDNLFVNGFSDSTHWCLWSDSHTILS